MGKGHWIRRKQQAERNQQYASLWLESQLEQERARCYLGSAKVNVDVFTFDPLSPRDVHENNLERLLSSFKLGGFSQLEPAHHVPVIIPRVEFTEAVSRAGSTEQVTRERDSLRWPLLQFNSEFRLQCLRGKHRVEVAKQYLLGRNRWWVADFYADDLSTELRNHLTYQTSNEQPPSAGEIYFRILQADHAASENVDGWWAQIQSVHERRELQRLFARPSLNAPFRKLSQMPACGRGMLAGYVGTMLRLKCDEEIQHYLQHIYSAWSFILDGNPEWMSKLDVRTVECLASRIPARSRSDAAELEPLIVRGSIFQSFTQYERDQVWENLCRYPYRIPSLRTFFKDLLYLEMLAECVKKLVKPLRRQSVFQALRQAYCRGREMEPDRNDDTDFRRSYKSLYLSAMQHLEALRPGSVLLEVGDTRTPVGKNLRAWYSFAEEAYFLGFWSEAIDAARSVHPDRLAARTLLLDVRDPAEFVYEEAELESLISEMVTIFNRAKRIGTPADHPQLVCEGEGEIVDRRCGRPYRKAYEASARHLTMDNMNLPNEESGEGITAFFIRRDVYLSFFGPCDVLDAPGGDNMSVGNSAPSSLSHESSGLFQSPTVSDRMHGSGSATVDFGPDHADNTDGRDSESQYSQPSLDPRLRTVPALTGDPLDQSERALNTDTQTETSPGVQVTFISLAGSRPEIVEDRKIVDPVEVMQIVGRYTRGGRFLFDRSLRSLAPMQCWDVAREGGSIYLVPENRSTFSAAAILDSSSHKRAASGELPRPRKLLVAD